MSDNYPVDGELRRQAERIEALEQAHAELAAKVAKLETRVDVHKAGIEWCHEHVKGSELSEDAPNVVEQAYYAHRVFPTGLLAREFARVTRIGPDDVDYVPALESPVPAPDPVCARCPHSLSWHCKDGECGVEHCACLGFVPTAEPAPLDPVRSIMKLVLQYGADTANAAVCYRHNKDKEADDHNEKAYMRTQEIEAAIRAYGRDGAR